MEMMNDFFKNNGYVFIPGVISDPNNLFCPPPVDSEGNYLSGQLCFSGKKIVQTLSNENQVEGSFARYNFPRYKRIHHLIGKLLEGELGIDLFPTYFYERFYYIGQELTRHTDRPSCEISVTLQISSNSNKPWPIWFQLPDGSETSVEMNDGDVVVYKGCEREHWREPLQSRYGRVKRLWKRSDDTYHHQIFLHYVDAQGPYVQYAFDRG